MRSWQILPIFALAALCGPGFGQVKIKLHREYTLQEKNEIRMEFERIDELPTVEQEKVVPRIYRDLYLSLIHI